MCWGVLGWFIVLRGFGWFLSLLWLFGFFLFYYCDIHLLPQGETGVFELQNEL